VDCNTFSLFVWGNLDQNRRLPPLRMGGEKANSRIRTILNGRDRAWIGLPFATLIDIRGIIPSPLARLSFTPGSPRIGKE
jgi:hypothetical protein